MPSTAGETSEMTLPSKMVGCAFNACDIQVRIWSECAPPCADGVTGMRVRQFVLVMQNPFRPGELVTPDQMRLTAAHEMGHALGLPHSDSSRDVLYPTNTANTLSAQDFKAMNGLYGLENGAILSEEALAVRR